MQHLWFGFSAAQSSLYVLAATLLVATGLGVAARLRARLFRGHARLREIIDAVPEAVAYCDAQDRMIFWNKAYDDLAKRSSMPVQHGVPFHRIIESALATGGYPAAAGREQEWLAERMAQHLAPHTVHEHRLKDGQWRRIEERRTAEGGVIMVLVDITDLKRDAQTLSEARDLAQNANRAKGEFLANMSHEIRTPLNGVIGLTDVLARTALDPNQREIVEIIRSSGVTLERLLTEVLDLARIESGRMEIRNESFDLGEAVRQVAGLAELRAQDKGVAFRLQMDPAAGGLVEGDPDRLKQILLNLLSNAVKFTEQGEVTLRVLCAPNAEGRSIRFEVSDTGVGFSMQDKERLFQRFEQADGSITRKFGGSGLGLSIVHELAGLMGGFMDAEGEQGRGATFIVELPLPVSSGPPQVDDQAGVQGLAEPLAVGARVLLAEDHPTNRKVVELMLLASGAELLAVEDGAQAVEAFQREHFDLVLMDLQMPVMDGLEATRAIRAHERAFSSGHTPIVALTANALPEHIQASVEAGADAHLAKPITASALLPLIDRLLKDAAPELQAASAA